MAQELTTSVSGTEEAKATQPGASTQLHAGENHAYQMAASMVPIPGAGEEEVVGAGIAVGANALKGKGGVYALLYDEKLGVVAGNVARTGRTSSLWIRRLADQLAYPELTFYRLVETESYAAQRGLEQMLHEKFAPPLNKINGISPRNPLRQYYLDAGAALAKELKLNL